MQVPAAPADLKFICPSCSARRTATIITLAAEDNRARCTVCATQFSVATRYVLEARPHQVDTSRTRYELRTWEGDGRSRPRVFEAQANIRLRSATWVTFVRRDFRFVGVADQTHSVWNPIVELPDRFPALARLWRLLLAACAALAAGYAIAFADQVHEFAATGGGAVVALLAACVLALLPLIWWTIRTGFGEDVGNRRTVPVFRDDHELM